jgi:hypothetical protein
MSNVKADAGMCSRSGPEKVIDQLNATNAKVLALALVLLFLGGHGLLHLRYGTSM